MASKSPQDTSQSAKDATGKGTGKAEKLTPEEQSRRFIETAKELGADENKSNFLENVDIASEPD